MIITLLTETYWPEVNGVAMTLHRLMTGLSNLGHRIQLVCPNHSDRDISNLPDNVFVRVVRGLPIPGYSEAKFGLPAQKILRKMWLAQRPDIIYVATEGPLGWSAIKEANAQNIPVISGFHTNFHTYSRHYKLGMFEKIVKNYLVGLHNKTLSTLVPTEGQKSLVENMGIKNSSILGRGVDATLFSPKKRSHALRDQWSVNGNDPVLIYVGRIAAEKNIALAIETYYKLRQLNANLKFVLVGDGPLRSVLKKSHPELIFAGMRTGEDLATHYASGDIFVFPSLTETFGNVVLEAMASGLGVVAYDYAAARLHIAPNENGMLVKIGDSEEFVSKMKIYLENELLLKKIRLNASRYAQLKDWSIIIKQFENILEMYAGSKSTAWELAG